MWDKVQQYRRVEYLPALLVGVEGLHGDGDTVAEKDAYSLAAGWDSCLTYVKANPALHVNVDRLFHDLVHEIVEFVLPQDRAVRVGKMGGRNIGGPPDVPSSLNTCTACIWLSLISLSSSPFPPQNKSSSIVWPLVVSNSSTPSRNTRASSNPHEDLGVGRSIPIKQVRTTAVAASFVWAGWCGATMVFRSGDCLVDALFAVF